MRFKKGTKVEVFSKEDVTMGAWRCAEVISCYGDMYKVKYGLSPLISDSYLMIDRVPEEAVRPCPPPVEQEGHWVKDDVVEVLDDFSWKMARVEKVVDGNTFLVRLFGLCEGFRVHKSHLRDRQCWQDGKWSLIGKRLENFGRTMGRRLPDTRAKQWSPADENETCMVSGRTLKRRSPYSVLEEYQSVASGKRRVIAKDGCHQQMFSVHESSTFDQVFSYKMLGENRVHSSFHAGTAEFSGMNTRENDSCLIESSISLDSDSCSSSVASCSVMGSDGNVWISTQHNNDSEDCFSDAESSSEPSYAEKGCSSDRKTGLEAHRSEFCTYVSVVEALYASGPLSWEDEERLTNLRRLLHISTDEHLMVNISSAILGGLHAFFLKSQMMMLKVYHIT